MIQFCETYLPIVIYILLIILLVVGIILGIRLIGAMDKVDDLLDNVKGKVNSLNGFFNVIDFTTDKIALFADKIVDVVSGLIFKAKSLRKRKNKEEEEEDYE